MAKTPSNPQDFDVTPASDIALKEVSYFWHDRIPFGMISLAAGRPGGGKSTIMSDVLAHVTRDLKHGAILSNQEDAESVVRARLEAAGADLSKVFTPPAPYRFPEDINLLALHITAHGAKVAVFDAAAQHLGRNMNNDQDIRQALSPLAKLADATGCAMIFVTHVVKHFSKSAHPLTAIGGSGGGLPGASRGIFFVGPNPEDERGRACVWVKDQYRQLPPALTFELEEYVVEDDEQKIKAMTQRAILADDSADIDPVAVLTGKARDDDGSNVKADKRAAAAEWLTIYLSAGKRAATDLRNDGATAGLSWATIRRAADDVAIEKYREGFGKGSKLYWQLPDGHPALVSDEDVENDTPLEADDTEVEKHDTADGLAPEALESGPMEDVLNEENGLTLTDEDVAALLGGGNDA